MHIGDTGCIDSRAQYQELLLVETSYRYSGANRALALSKGSGSGGTDRGFFSIHFKQRQIRIRRRWNCLGVAHGHEAKSRKNRCAKKG